MSTGHSPKPAALPRRLGQWSAMAIVIGSTIGSGIFRSPAEVAGQVPGPLAMLLVWAAGGFFALCGALSISELASAFPRTGGLYAFLREGWGRRPAFLFGWSQLVILRAAALGAIAITFAEYAVRLAGFDPIVAPGVNWVPGVAAAAIALTAGFNIAGVRWGAAVNFLTVVGKYGALCFIILVATAWGLSHPHGYFPQPAPMESFRPGAFGLALVAVLWVYDGWADVSYVAGEVSDPRRNLPRAIIGGTLAVVVIYLLANVGYLAVLPVEQIRTSSLVAADVAQEIFGSAGATFVSAAVVLSTFGTLSANLLTNPRILFAMADDGLLFKSVARVHGKYQTPYVAIALIAGLGLVLVLCFDFKQLADAFVVAMLPFYALGIAAIYRLRRRPGYRPAFRTPAYPWVPALFILSVGFLLAGALSDPTARTSTLVVFAVILTGLPVFRFTVARRGATPEEPSPGGEEALT